ncbi:MAG TPA: hypothetical protein VF135_06065 [Terriglobales bacterium]
MAESGSPRSSGGAAGALGSNLGSAVRVLRGEQGRRVARGLFHGLGAFFSAISRVVHLLFLEVTGFVFLCFAIIGGFALVREYPGLVAGRVSQGRFGVTLIFTVMFAWFGLTSFWRARRKQ